MRRRRYRTHGGPLTAVGVVVVAVAVTAGLAAAALGGFVWDLWLGLT